MSRFERAHLGLDAEQRRQKVFEMRTQRDQHRGFAEWRSRVGKKPGSEQPIDERSIYRAQMIDERAIDSRRSLGRVKIAERKAVGKVHCGSGEWHRKMLIGGIVAARVASTDHTATVEWCE